MKDGETFAQPPAPSRAGTYSWVRFWQEQTAANLAFALSAVLCRHPGELAALQQSHAAASWRRLAALAPPI